MAGFLQTTFRRSTRALAGYVCGKVNISRELRNIAKYVLVLSFALALFLFCFCVLCCNIKAR